MVELIGRDQELAGLERAWTRARSGVPQLAVMWGRRRVGKTFLLTHFAADNRDRSAHTPVSSAEQGKWTAQTVCGSVRRALLFLLAIR
jgi:AAA+ ATPase superfamily predicted ATPase